VSESDAPASATGGNRLADASSPYLLQHADNPVHWHPWGEEAFREARERDRPVFLSIGYSTCHWCHVMAHESFEDEEVARLLNEHFVPVKVDREERPDVDGVYMTACQAMSGQGGWPLTIVTTPDREPFFAGTYFPKESRGGRPGLVDLLERIADLWEHRREKLHTSARQVTAMLRRTARGEPGAELSEEDLGTAFRRLESRFDEVQGGFGGAPKFPTPQHLLFLLRYGERSGERRATAMVARTLESMRRGGIWDHVGYGFHRYSTDARWLLPHFEKMLYDQALLCLAFVEAYQATGRASFARTARQIVAYVLRDLRDPAGGFHSAEDADSEGEEGTFYVWREEELRERLDPDDFELVKSVYNTRTRGNYAEEATGERTGRNILHRQRSLAEIAREREMEEEALRRELERIRGVLFAAREERARPHRDDKVLTDWNGLMIAALARAGAVLEEPDHVQAAREAAEFLLAELRAPTDEPGAPGRLLHRWRDGEADVPANADDYAFLVLGLIELYEATFEPRWLREALVLREELDERCRDPDQGGYFFAPSDAEDLPVRQKESHDGALPSGNSVAHWNAVRLARLTGDPTGEERAVEIERAFGARIRKSPTAFTGLLVGVDFRLGPARELVLAADRGDLEGALGGRSEGDGGGSALRAMLRIVRGGFHPRTVTLFRPAGDASPIAAIAPWTEEHVPREGRPTAYLCHDFACRAPTTDPEELRSQLEEG